MSEFSDLYPSFASRPKIANYTYLFTTQYDTPEEKIQESIENVHSTNELLKSEGISPRTLRRARADVRKTLEAVHHVAISIESWKWGVDDIRPMYTATAHFIHDSKFVSQILFTRYDGIGTIHKLDDLYVELVKWNLLNKVVCFVTTGSECKWLSRITFSRYLEHVEIPRLYCVADLINEVIQNSLTYIKFEDFATKFEEFKEKRNDSNGLPYQYNILKSICNIFKPFDFANEDRKMLGELYQVLRPFEDLRIKLSTQAYVPLSEVIPLVKDLKIKISESVPSNVSVKDLWGKLLARHCLYNVADSFPLKATFMDPRFKTIAFSQKEADNVQKSLVKELRENFKNNERVDDQKNVFGTRNTSATYNPAKSVLSYYANLPNLSQNEDPLKFWSDFNRFTKCDEFSKMAEKYLCIPSNATPLSRKFVWVKISNNRLIYKRRHLLEYKNIDKLLFLQSYNSRMEK